MWRNRYFKFNYDKLFGHILNINGLSDAVHERNVEIDIIIYGAQLCKGLSHMTAGIKDIDKDARNSIK